MFKKLVISAALLACFVLPEAHANETVHISYTAAELDNPAAASALYKKIVKAARTVCDSGMNIGAARLADFRCQRETVSATVGDIGLPALTAYYEAVTSRKNSTFAAR